jgi:hypothetical protein
MNTGPCLREKRPPGLPGMLLQRLRPAPGRQGQWESRYSLHRPGAAGTTHRAVLRWPADPLLRLRRRHRTWHAPGWHGPGGSWKVFHIGSDREICVKELAETIRDYQGSGPELIHQPFRRAFGEGLKGTRRRVPDVCRAAEHLGFRAEVPLDGGLCRAISWFCQIEPHNTRDITCASCATEETIVCVRGLVFSVTK